MSADPSPPLSRRERQIMDIIYRMGEATAQDVQERLPSPPSYSGVRGLLRVLEEKGHVSHRADGARYVYQPTVPREEARDAALRQVLQTFFDGSPAKAVAALLDLSATAMTAEEYGRMEELLEHARTEGGRP